MRINPFDPSTKDKKPKEIQERVNAANREVNDLIDNAKECLADPKFRQFRDGYNRSFGNLIQILLEMPRDDDRVFSAQVDSIRAKIHVLQGLGLIIEDAAKAVKRPIIEAPKTTEGLNAG